MQITACNLAASELNRLRARVAKLEAERGEALSLLRVALHKLNDTAEKLAASRQELIEHLTQKDSNE
jgi:hypothetical protein